MHRMQHAKSDVDCISRQNIGGGGGGGRGRGVTQLETSYIIYVQARK